MIGALTIGTPWGRYRAGPGDREIKVGRDRLCQVVLDDHRVSRQHLTLEWERDRWWVYDLGTYAGTYLDGRRINRVPVDTACTLRLGAPDGMPLSLWPGEGGAEVPGPGPAAVPHLAAGPEPAMAGAYRAGPAAARSAVLAAGAPPRMETGAPPVLRAAGLTVTARNGRTLLDEVGFSIDGGLLAVVGPSGAGKSTLLNALTGIKPASSGRVQYHGVDLYRHYDRLRHRIGLVPQDDILHRQLPVRRALRYAAALRLGRGVGRSERHRRIDEVIGQLSLTGHEHQRISTLSGGQRKRTSVALELLNRPYMLFLDEPTSGLDPALDLDVMTALRQLADQGRTVVVATHSVLNLDLCDRVLVLGAGGRLTYFGHPDRMLGFFGAQTYAEVFQQVAANPGLWVHHYRRAGPMLESAAARSGRHARRSDPAAEAPTLRLPEGDPRKHLNGGGPANGGPANGSGPTTGSQPAVRSDVQAEPPGRHSPGRRPARPAPLRPPRHSFLRQLGIITRRTAAVAMADRFYAALMIGLPLALAALVHVVPGSDGLTRPATVTGRSAEAGQILVILTVGGVFLGLAGGIRELITERAIYRRERTVGLSPGAYLCAKLIVSTLINTAQATVFVLVGLWGRPLPKHALLLGSPLAELLAAITLIVLTSTILGLLVSAFVSSNEQTMPMLVGLVMTQLVLCGGLFSVSSRAVISEISWLAPARWAYAAAAAGVGLRDISPNHPQDTLWRHTGTAWLIDMGVLLGQALVLLLATRIALRRHEPGR